MRDTVNYNSRQTRVGVNPPIQGIAIHIIYADGPAYWLLGHFEELYSFEMANGQLNEWSSISRGRGFAAFTIYFDGMLVYKGLYDFSITPVDLKKRINLYLEELDTTDAVILLGALAEENPKLEKGYIDPDTGAWRSRRRFETGADVSDMSEPIIEDANIVDDINQALLGGTLGIGIHGLVTEASRERIDTGEGAPEAARTWHRAEEHRLREARRARDEREREAQAAGRTRPTGVEIYRFTPERIEEINIGHDLDLGGYEYENVRDGWARIFAAAGITGVLEIDADTFGGEVMGSSRDFFGINIHSLNLPVVLFEPGANIGRDVSWPETLPDEQTPGHHPDTYVLVNHGVLNEYEHDCICSEEPVDTERENCPRCEGTGYVEHVGGRWALYKWVEGEEMEDDEELRSQVIADIREGVARSIMANAWGDYLEQNPDVMPADQVNLYHDAPMTEELKNVLLQMADRFIDKVNLANRIDSQIEDPYMSFMQVDTFIPDNEADSAESYGHYLFMEAMGHGVNWMDDASHEDHDLTLPSIECNLQRAEHGNYVIYFDGDYWPLNVVDAEINMEDGSLVNHPDIDNAEHAEEWLTERYGPHRGLNADWISLAWPIGHNLWVVDEESEDIGGRPLYSIVKRVEVDGEYEDTVMWDPSPFVDIIEIIRQRELRERGELREAVDDLVDLAMASGVTVEEAEGIYALGAGGELPTTVLNERFGPAVPTPWPAVAPRDRAWLVRPSTRWGVPSYWIWYKRQDREGGVIYQVVQSDSLEPEQTVVVYTGTVLRILNYLESLGLIPQRRER